MSSLLNVSNDASRKSEEFSIKDIEVFVDSEEQNWFKRANVGKFLGIEGIRKSLNNLEKCEILSRQELVPTRRSTPGWSGSKNHQNKTDKYLSFFGVMYAIVNSQKDKGKVLKEHTLKDIVPRGFDARIEEIKEKLLQAIEEKDATITLLNDDLKIREYKNVALQAQKDVYKEQLQKYQDTIAHLKTRSVPHARDPGKDNIIIIVRKHATSANDKYHDLPYYIGRIQRRKRYVKLRWFDRHFPNYEVIVEIGNPNSIHAFNRFEEEGHAERKYNDFRLIDLTREDLNNMGVPAVLDDDEEE